MTDNKDHDDVIRNTRDMEVVCKWMKKIDDKLDVVIDKKVSYKVFFWVVGFIIFAVMSLTAFTGNVKSTTVKNCTCIEKLENK